MRPACLDNPNIRCRWDDTVGACPCQEAYEPEPARPVENVKTIGDLLVTEQRHTADTITDDALDALYAERDRWQRGHETAEAQLVRERPAFRALEEQLVTARSAIDRVRALHQRWDASPGDCAHCITGPGNLVPWPCPTIQALDTPEP